MKIAFISDIHEDIQNLEKSLVMAEKSGCQKIICLGDIFGYGLHQNKHYRQPDFDMLYSIVRKHVDMIVLGNHDVHHLGRIPDELKNNPVPDNWFDLYFDERSKIAGDKVYLHQDDIPPAMNSRAMNFFRKFHYFSQHEFAGEKVFLSHYLYPNLSGTVSGFYLSPGEMSAHFDYLRQQSVRYSFCGHGHPNGAVMCYPHIMRIENMGSFHLKKTPVAIICPSISKSNRFSGFITFDFKEKVLDIYPLS